MNTTMVMLAASLNLAPGGFDAAAVSARLSEQLLSTDPARYEPRGYRAEKTADGVRLVRNGRTVWAFSTTGGKPSVHPLSFPDGNAVTDSLNADHPWHRGLWFSWKFLNGVNFWETDAYGESEGEQRVAACDVRTQGGGATVRMDVQWGPRNEPSRVFLDERREIVFSEPDADGAYEIRWKARFTARETTVVERTPPRTLADGRRRGGYAGLSLRLADFAKTFDCETDGRRSISYRSPKSGQVVRLRIVRAPETSFCYHWEDNRFTSLSPVFDKPLTLAPGETLDLEYAISCFSQGKTDERPKAGADSVSENLSGLCGLRARTREAGACARPHGLRRRGRPWPQDTRGLCARSARRLCGACLRRLERV